MTNGQEKIVLRSWVSDRENNRGRGIVSVIRGKANGERFLDIVFNTGEMVRGVLESELLKNPLWSWHPEDGLADVEFWKGALEFSRSKEAARLQREVYSKRRAF